ncbi:hypothetical protein PAXRUDRAFT_832863 [Paxillus rubicundulus Ve08.2h10]|uniref:Unplaced genomic scaffold scaffold_976, whole genome shotgun sequence n=1 Tax=Paxillus rubicundulus Ve08.2h10 TaxID=930991 RepID=A0A0D0DQ91_9AGAM|nr:hypothetical protein PAXRUDRAFT_832863 [Paxillus rubicundulus Ve08.2h10]
MSSIVPTTVLDSPVERPSPPGCIKYTTRGARKRSWVVVYINGTSNNFCYISGVGTHLKA